MRIVVRGIQEGSKIHVQVYNIIIARKIGVCLHFAEG